MSALIQAAYIVLKDVPVVSMRFHFVIRILEKISPLFSIIAFHLCIFQLQRATTSCWAYLYHFHPHRHVHPFSQMLLI